MMTLQEVISLPGSGTHTHSSESTAVVHMNSIQAISLSASLCSGVQIYRDQNTEQTSSQDPQ